MARNSGLLGPGKPANVLAPNRGDHAVSWNARRKIAVVAAARHIFAHGLLRLARQNRLRPSSTQVARRDEPSSLNFDIARATHLVPDADADGGVEVGPRGVCAEQELP